MKSGRKKCRWSFRETLHNSPSKGQWHKLLDARKQAQKCTLYVSLSHAKLPHVLLHMPAQCHQLLSARATAEHPALGDKAAPLCSRTCLELYIFPFICRPFFWPCSAGWEVSISLWLRPGRRRVGQSHLPSLSARLPRGQWGEAWEQLRQHIFSKNTRLR